MNAQTPVVRDTLRVLILGKQPFEIKLDGPTTIADVLVQLIRKDPHIGAIAKGCLRHPRQVGHFYVQRGLSCCIDPTPAAKYRETLVRNGDSLSFADTYLFHYGSCPDEAIANDKILEWLEMSHSDAWRRYWGPPTPPSTNLPNDNL